MATICDIFAEICQDQKRLRKLLNSNKESAQRILNLVHMVSFLDMKVQQAMLTQSTQLLDYSHLDDRLHSSLFLVLMRLSAECGLYPQCYALKGVQCENIAVTAGHFGEIWKGKLKGQIVCLKVVKVYQKSCLAHLLKVLCLVLYVEYAFLNVNRHFQKKLSYGGKFRTRIYSHSTEFIIWMKNTGESA